MRILSYALLVLAGGWWLFMIFATLIIGLSPAPFGLTQAKLFLYLLPAVLGSLATIATMLLIRKTTDVQKVASACVLVLATLLITSRIYGPLLASFFFVAIGTA